VLNWNGKKVGEGEMEKSATEGAEWREGREQQAGKQASESRDVQAV